MSALHSQTETPYQDHKEGTDTENTEEWKLVTARISRKTSLIA